MPYKDQSPYCRSQSKSQFCANGVDFGNRILRDFVCPASETYCPATYQESRVIVSSSKEYAEREHKWTKYVPTSAARDWHCKYHVSAAPSLITSEVPEMRGYLYLEGEQYGFDEELYIIVQPQGQFFDFSIENPVNDITKVYKGYFGRKFLIPAEFDVLIYFAPIKFNSKK